MDGVLVLSHGSKMTESQRDFLGSGVRVRVVESGPEAASPVILIHGAFMDCRTWRGLADYLDQEFRVFSPDLPGSGESEKPPASRFAYNVESFTETLVDLYGALGLGRASVVGHGLGGAIAITLAALHPELVSRLVVVDAICQPPPAGSIHQALTAPFLGGLLLKQFVGQRAYRLFFRQWLLGPNSAVPNSRIDAYFHLLGTPSGRASLFSTLRATSDTRPIIARTVRLITPTLVVWGRRDRLQPVSIGQRLSREIRGSGFELLDSGHSPQEETPKALADVIRRFLRAERPASG